jgi:membrane peptidoglycan carboxypeptidase
LYYNNVFWGKNIYGLRGASLEYFLKEPEQLSTSEQMILITLLRGPNFYLHHTDKLKKRYHFLSNSLHKKKILSSNKFTKINKTKIAINNNNLQTYRNDSVPYIANTIIHSDYSIYSSINKEFQIEVTKYISQCSYPTSLLCVYKGKVLGVGSSFGSDYPFKYKANVGSTLKPFIYTFLRENGTRKDALFSTKCDTNASWDIHEVESTDVDFLPLEEALIRSNNNVFVNASYKIGIEKVQSFLAKTFRQQIDNFVPASVLGATTNGISLYELVSAYQNHFIKASNNPIINECVSILKEIAKAKFGNNIYDLFLKTGTTNKNKERYGIIGMGRLLFGFLRQGNEINDYSKEGNYLSSIMGFLRSIRNKIYKWD